MKRFTSFCISAALISILYYIKKYCGGPICYCKARLENKIVVVTGGTSGIGLSIIQHFASLGAIVIFTARDIEKGVAIQENIRSITSNPRVFCKFVDFIDLGSVYNFATEVNQICPNIHLLVNNIGVFFHPPQETVDGFDVTFQSNYLSHFLLTELLIDKFQRGSRIIFLSSAAHKLSKELDLTILLESYKKATTTSDRLLSYANSKLCLLLYAKTLAKHMKDKEVRVFSVDPGSVETPIYRHFPFLQNPILKLIQKPIRFIVIRNPFQGSQTIFHCALSPHLKEESGLLYSDLKSVRSSSLSCDLNLASQLYNQSLIWTALKK